MRADRLAEPQSLPGDLDIEMQATPVRVFEGVQMPLNSELNVVARDDVAVQNGVAIIADAVGTAAG